MSRPTLAVGDVIHVHESDYRYGIGELYFRITRIPPGTLAPGVDWAELLGVDIAYDGSTGPERHVTVRLAAVRVTPRDELTGR